jgi:predicted enzyme related to lactoylglutathione lyase
MKAISITTSFLLLLLIGCNNEPSTEENESKKETTEEQVEQPQPTEQEKPTTMADKKQKKVTGIGGIFFKCKDPVKMREWYDTNLGLVTNEYGSLFEFRSTDNPEEINYLQWSPFGEKTKYFEPSKKDYMINYRVENLEGLIKELRADGIEIVGEIQEFEYGKFAHILDPEGNKLELWEPVDSVFTKTNEGKTTH